MRFRRTSRFPRLEFRSRLTEGAAEKLEKRVPVTDRHACEAADNVVLRENTPLMVRVKLHSDQDDFTESQDHPSAARKQHLPIFRGVGRFKTLATRHPP
jgi:hypothetical protein